MTNVNKNMSVRDAIRYAYDRGATVDKNSAGEIRFAFPGLIRCRINHKRKDAPRPLIVWLRKLPSNGNQ